MSETKLSYYAELEDLRKSIRHLQKIYCERMIEAADDDNACESDAYCKTIQDLQWLTTKEMGEQYNG